MAVAQATILAGLYSWLTADSSFNTLVGGSASSAGRVRYGFADRDETLPYAVMFNVVGTDYESMQKSGYDYRVQISLFGSIEDGPSSVMAVYDALRSRLHRQKPTVSGHQQGHVWMDQPRGPIREEDAWSIQVDALVRGFET